MWGGRLREALKSINYAEDSGSNSDTDSNSYHSPPPSTPAEEGPLSLGEFRETTDRLTALQVVQEAAQALAPLEVRQVTSTAKMTNYDRKNEEDDDNAIQNARDVKLPFNQHDIRLWFTRAISIKGLCGAE